MNDIVIDLSFLFDRQTAYNKDAAGTGERMLKV